MSAGAPNNDAVMEISSLCKAYGSRKVLQDLNLTVYPGETCALLGRNGTGKSTLVRILTGTLEQDSGTVRILGSDPAQCAQGFIPGVAYLAESKPLFPWLRVSDTIELFSKIHARWNSHEAARLADLLSLSGRASVSSLSRGEQGKLALIGVLASEPDVLILDEPTAGLDPAVRRSFLEAILSSMVDSGKTVFYVTHDLYEAQRLAGRVMILDKGAIALQGDVETLRTSHRKVGGRLSERQALPSIEGIVNLHRNGEQISFDFTCWDSSSEERIRACGIEIDSIHALDLEDIFCIHFGDRSKFIGEGLNNE